MKMVGALSGKGRRYVELAREHPGWTAKQVREAAGMSPGGAKRLRRFYGLENRQARPGTHLRLPVLSLRTRMAADLVARGHSVSEAARLLEVSRQAVQQAVKRVQKRRGQGHRGGPEPAVHGAGGEAAGRGAVAPSARLRAGDGKVEAIALRRLRHGAMDSPSSSGCSCCDDYSYRPG